MLSILSIILGMLIISIFNGSSISESAILFVIVVFFLCYLIDINFSKRLSKYIVPLSVGLGIRLLFLFYDIYTNNPFRLPYIGGAMKADAMGFYNSAVIYSQGNPIRYGGYFSKFLGIIFRLTGSSRLLAEFIVLLFSIAVFHVTIRMFEELQIDDSVSWYMLFLLAVLPNFAFLSVIVRRETIIAFFVSLSILYYLKWVNNKGIGNIVLASIFALVGSLFHGATGLIIVGFIFSMLIYDNKKSEFRIDLKNIVIASIAMGLFVILFSKFGSSIFSKLDKLEDISSVAKQSSLGGSSYAQYVGDSNNLFRFFVYLIPRYIYYMFSPFPWQWRGISDIISFLFSSVFYLYVVFRSVLLIWKKDLIDLRSRKIIVLLLLVSIIISIVFSWGVTNTGTAIRHRDKFISLYIIMIALYKNGLLIVKGQSKEKHLLA